ncbi:MAG: BspA family leucine-rich repeat surface protein [Oscillospiraceae bacterium]|nr:BspA family leucine-rich repeat surface protein [Oscillospiraceae bacterium]
MKTRNHSLRRVFASALAVTTAAAIVIAGTYGWSAISQFAKGTADGATQNGGGETQTGPGGRLHFDFDRESGAAEVYAENFGTEPLFVRARLNVTTDLTDSEVSYSFGGSKIFMPTFLKDSTVLYSDVTGDAIDPEREDAPVPEFPDYTENQTKTDTAYYTDQTNALATHKAKSTIVGDAPIAIADWDKAPVNRWFRDSDGWYYWGAPLQPGDATSLLLNAIEFKADRSDWEFVILPEAEFVDIDDANKFDGISEDAKELLGNITELRGVLGAIGGPIVTENDPFWPANGADSIIPRNQVLSVTVENYIPADLETDPIYLHSWDVSELGDGSVMAWYTPAGEADRFDVFLGAEGGVKTGENATRFFFLFRNVTTIDVSKLDTSNTTAMQSMFESTSALTSLDVSSFDTSNVTNMAIMFRNTRSLTSLDLSSFNTSNVTTMNGMFLDARALTSLDLSHFDTSNVTIMTNMFRDTTNLTSLDMSGADFDKVTNASNMFTGSGLLDAGSEFVKNEAAADFINSLNPKPASVVVVAGPQGTFGGSINLGTSSSAGTTFWPANSNNSGINKRQVATVTVQASIDIPDGAYSWDVSDQKNRSVMAWYTATGSVNSDGEAMYDLYLGAHGTVKAGKIMSNLFRNFTNVTSIDASKLETANVTDMGQMFYGTASLKRLDFSTASFVKIISSGSMFQGSGLLTGGGEIIVKDTAARVFITALGVPLTNIKFA